jgi:hypothetical protein
MTATRQLGLGERLCSDREQWMNIPSPKIRLAIVVATGMVGGYAHRYALEHSSDLWACTPVPKKASRH